MPSSGQALPSGTWVQLFWLILGLQVKQYKSGVFFDPEEVPPTTHLASMAQLSAAIVAAGVHLASAVQPPTVQARPSPSSQALPAGFALVSQRLLELEQ